MQNLQFRKSCFIFDLSFYQSKYYFFHNHAFQESRIQPNEDIKRCTWYILLSSVASARIYRIVDFGVDAYLVGEYRSLKDAFEKLETLE